MQAFTAEELIGSDSVQIKEIGIERWMLENFGYRISLVTCNLRHIRKCKPQGAYYVHVAMERVHVRLR